MFPCGSVAVGLLPRYAYTIRARKIQLHNTDHLGCYSLPISAKHEIGRLLCRGAITHCDMNKENVELNLIMFYTIPTVL